jgi:hypothetical protein
MSNLVELYTAKRIIHVSELEVGTHLIVINIEPDRDHGLNNGDEVVITSIERRCCCKKNVCDTCRSDNYKIMFYALKNIDRGAPWHNCYNDFKTLDGRKVIFNKKRNKLWAILSNFIVKKHVTLKISTLA